MAKFRKKPIVIGAVCNDGEWRPIVTWLEYLGGGMAFQPFSAPPVTRNPDGSLNVVTLEGTIRCGVGDYLIQGVKGELYPCKPDIFAATYEPESEAVPS